MPRYIDANILMQDIDKRGADFWCSSVDISNAKKIVSEQPTADAQEVIHSRWIPLSDNIGQCANCAAIRILNELRRYCPSCGAKMDWEGLTE